MLSSGGLGLAAGLSPIVAIGVQNAFALRQGIRQEPVGAVVAVCAVSDALLITAGMAGLGAVVEQAAGVLRWLTWFGAAYLIGYGLLLVRRALRPTAGLEAERGATTTSVAAAVSTALALTWLNPHVYLDPVVLLGSIGNGEGPSGRWWFGGGAVLDSLPWFKIVGYGGTRMA